jgi:predicted NBD/HSP70 family sugar kinase
MQRLKRSDLRVVNAIYLRHHATRRSIEKQSGLSLVKVSAILRDLTSDGIVRHVGNSKSSGGRPSKVYQLNPAFGTALGVSFSTKAIRVAGVDATKQLTTDREFALELPEDPEQQGEAILRQVSEALQESIAGDGSQKPPCAIGLALPGIVDTRKGLWLQGFQSASVTHVRLPRLLEERLRIRVFPEDIARALAYREMLVGNARTVRDFVVLHFGMGMGTGVVIGRRLYAGHKGLAGEVGHIKHQNSSLRCSCGSIGCFETIVSVPGVLRIFRDRLAEGVVSCLQRVITPAGPGLSLETILEAANAGDRFAVATLREVGQVLGHACAIMFKICNPQRLIVSGEGSVFRKFLETSAREVLTAEVSPIALQGSSLVFADFEPRNEAVGAGLVAMGRLVKNLIRSPTSKRAVPG